MKDESLKGTAQDVHVRLRRYIKRNDIVGATSLWCHYMIESGSKHPDNVFTDEDYQLLHDKCIEKKEYNNSHTYYVINFYQLYECRFIIGLAIREYELMLAHAVNCAAKQMLIKGEIDEERRKEHPSQERLRELQKSIENINYIAAINDVKIAQEQYVSMLAAMWKHIRAIKRLSEFIPNILQADMFAYKEKRDIVQQRLRDRVAGCSTLCACVESLCASLPAIGNVKVNKVYVEIFNKSLQLYERGLYNIGECLPK